MRDNARDEGVNEIGRELVPWLSRSSIRKGNHEGSKGSKGV